MKKISIILLFISGILTAQNKEHKESLSGIKKVQITTEAGVKIVAGNSNELILKDYIKEAKDDCDECEEYPEHHSQGQHHNHDKSFKEKTKGLTPIYAGGRDNTNGFGFSIVKEGSVLIVKDLKSFYQRRGVTIMLPKNLSISVDTGTLGTAKIDGFTSEVEVNTNTGRITMQDVTGPITAHSSTGPININFSKVNQTAPITISTAVGEIDVTIPAGTKANLDLDTNGTVYSNFDIQPASKKGLKNVSGLKKITSKLNNGGVKIKLRSHMGNIYLRKK
ncbi:DUF4097 family beta strand repeat-containing protein [Tenacibaculum amylolyticum]|uniref:DUF4097 family beta strand repeat-containing protein n=1 Tax=Tenacibaculum amylolyticum TaxID=104269 RepID=UPI003893B2FC